MKMKKPRLTDTGNICKALLFAFSVALNMYQSHKNNILETQIIVQREKMLEVLRGKCPQKVKTIDFASLQKPDAQKGINNTTCTNI